MLVQLNFSINAGTAVNADNRMWFSIRCGNSWVVSNINYGRYVNASGSLIIEVNENEALYCAVSEKVTMNEGGTFPSYLQFLILKEFND